VPADDHELLRRTVEGDRDAFEAFVLRHYDAALRYVESLASNRQDAEDALQDAFLAVWRSADGFRGEGSARAWLFTIARNALRRARRLRVGEPAAFEPIEDLGVRAGWGNARNRPSLDALADRQLAERCLQRLSSEDREILLLRDVEGFSRAEVARLLDLTLPAMKSRLHRARLRLVAAAKETIDA